MPRTTAERVFSLGNKKGGSGPELSAVIAAFPSRYLSGPRRCCVSCITCSFQAETADGPRAKGHYQLSVPAFQEPSWKPS